jgi:hypothetical protein
MMMQVLLVLASLGGLFFAGASVYYLARQVKESRKAVKAQFISSLENEFAALYDTYSKLLPDGDWFSTGCGPKGYAEIAQVAFYLSFCGKLEYLIELGAIDIETVNRLFAFRFFLAAHNTHVQEQILYADLLGDYWSDVFDLHRRWLEYRERKGLGVPFPHSILDSDYHVRKRNQIELA